MTALVFQLVGGIGLFLLGMVLLTDGLKSFAGDALRQALLRFTGRPLKAFASGALVTALVQSSSATTVTVIGFVSAGLLTFPQAVGVVFGASLGTTGTSWLVSVVGLKISVGFYALPLVGVGAFSMLLARGRWRALGMALAGFGIIFIGIQTLQDGMQGAAAAVDLERVPATGFLGHLLMMVIGVVMTVIMQSSSAAMATTLTALHTNSINFEQASSLVIGAAVGTTVTGALAAIGASVPARRTALAHVLFNLSAGLIAVALLPAFLWGIQFAQEHFGLEPGAMSLAAFHTAFIAFGVVIFLPFVYPFARFIERILPDKDPPFTRHLDNSLLNVPAVALEATRRALSDAACELLNAIRQQLADPELEQVELRAAQIKEALDAIQEFLTRVPPVAEDQPMSASRVAQIHAFDHLARLRAHLHPPRALKQVMGQPRLEPAIRRTRALLETAEAGLDGRLKEDWVEEVQRQSFELARERRRERPSVLAETGTGAWDPKEALNVLDAMRWLDRVGYHAWRISNYLGGKAEPEPPAPANSLP